MQLGRNSSCRHSRDSGTPSQLHARSCFALQHPEHTSIATSNIEDKAHNISRCRYLFIFPWLSLSFTPCGCLPVCVQCQSPALPEAFFLPLLNSCVRTCVCCVHRIVVSPCARPAELREDSRRDTVRGSAETPLPPAVTTPCIALFGFVVPRREHAQIELSEERSMDSVCRLAIVWTVRGRVAVLSFDSSGTLVGLA